MEIASGFGYQKTMDAMVPTGGNRSGMNIVNRWMRQMIWNSLEIALGLLVPIVCWEFIAVDLEFIVLMNFEKSMVCVRFHDCSV
ncbi:hypothetical protein L1987_42022 [Smallanthus sonchifolius]|uniref:Uncharacterized protein n=1 Tax=Smallanthus sonchifolius TaxID=185202 RepID=A0ACB9GX09_9ASTR|nr:hypothetical protein L1987_42022 [Smallanthus sonchifolius]